MAEDKYVNSNNAKMQNSSQNVTVYNVSADGLEGVRSFARQNVDLEQLSRDLLTNPKDSARMRSILDGRELNAEQLIAIFRKLKVNDPDNMSKVIRFLINEWNILKRMNKSADIEYLISNLISTFEEDLVKRFLLIKNQNGFNFIHALSGKGDITLVICILKIIAKELNNREFLRQLVESKTNENYNFLQVLCSSKINDVDSFGNLIVWVRGEKNLGEAFLNVLKRNSTKDENNCIHICTLSQPVEVLKVILVYLAKNLKHADFKSWLQEKDFKGENFLQVLSNLNPSAVPSIVSIMHGELKDQDFLKAILSSKDVNGQTIMHNLTTKGTTAFLEILQLKELNEDVLKSLMFDQVLYLLVNDFNTLAEAMKILKQKMQKDSFLRLFRSHNDNKEIFFKKFFAERDINESFRFYKMILAQYDEEFIKYIDKILDADSKSTDLLDSLLKSSANDEDKITFSFFYTISRIGFPHQKTLTFLFEKIKIKDVWTIKTKSGWNFIMTLAQQNNQTSFVDVIQLIRSKLGTEFVTELLKAKTTDGLNILHVLSQNNNQTCFGDFLQVLWKVFERNFVKELLMAKTNQNLTFLSLMCCSNLKTSPVKVLQVLFEKFDKDFTRKLLMVKSNKFGDDYVEKDEGWTFLHHFCEHNDKKNLMELLQFLIQRMDNASIKSLLSFKNHDGCTFLHYFSQHVDELYMVELLKFLLKECKSFVQELMLAVSYNKGGLTFLHHYCHSNENNSFLTLLKMLLENFDKKFLMTLFLIVCYNTRGTFLHYLCEYNKGTSYVELIDILWKAFDQDYIKKLFIVRTYGEMTFLQMLYSHNEPAYDSVLDSLNRKLGEDFVKTIK